MERFGHDFQMILITIGNGTQALQKISRDFKILEKVFGWFPHSSGALPQSLQAARPRILGPSTAGREREESHWVRQVHGTHIVEAGEHTAEQTTQRVEADGLLSRRPGETIAVRTSDCLPVLLAADTPSPLVMAVHAGWRGLAAGILDAALARSTQLHVPPPRLAAWIGPAIGSAAFEVGEEVLEAMAAGMNSLSREQFGWCASKGVGQGWHFDLQAAAVFILVNHGVDPQSIVVIRSCTRDARDGEGRILWHSARREGRGFGSNWSLVTAPERSRE